MFGGFSDSFGRCGKEACFLKPPLFLPALLLRAKSALFVIVFLVLKSALFLS